AGPRKSIDELWDEVFEYQQRIKLLEEIHQAQAAAAAATTAQAHYSPNLDQIDEEQQEELEEGVRKGMRQEKRFRLDREEPDQLWSEYGGGSETCYSASSFRSATSLADIFFATRKRAKGTMVSLGEQTPMVILSGTMTKIDRTTVYASRSGVRSDRGSALRLLHSVYSHD
ncbi:hypothetical protein BGZ65_008367, partial [Modicella reniformis]